MSRRVLAVLGLALAAMSANSNIVFAQSGSRGSGTPINSRPIQNYPVQQYGGQIINRQPVQGSSTIQQGSGGGGSAVRQNGSATQGSSSMQRETFESKFWNYLTSSRYKNWAPVPGQSAAAYEGQSPHGAMLKMYLNRAAAGSPTNLPDSSIIVKENYAADGQTLMAVTVMYKTKGYNPQKGDWYWIKYRPDGTVDQKVANGSSMRLAGKPEGCISCHESADGGDFAFFNDSL